MGLRFFGGALALLVVSGTASVQAQEVFVKVEEGFIQTRKLDIDLGEKSQISFPKPDQLKAFQMQDRKPLLASYEPRAMSDAERLIDASFFIFTGTLVIATHETYQITSELRLSSIRGVIFWFFPFEDHNLYLKCGDKEEFLIATTAEPKDDILKRLKSLKEARELCGVDQKS